MEIVVRFVSIVAWFGFVGFSLLGMFGLYMNVSYNRRGNLLRAGDMLRGVTREFRWHWHFMFAALCVAWLVAVGTH